MLRSALALVLVALVLGQAEELIVSIEQGTLRGYLSENGQYFEFYGIPYATMPTGDDKFKAPLDPPTWTDVFEAVNSKIVCPQFVVASLSALGDQQEDCLVTNVFVPNTTETNLPVMVYIHGGAFYVGSGNMVTHDLLLRHNVIVVNFNHRLGAHGFLCLGTEVIPGNAGMKDQVAALRWVKRNIAEFGGNPDDITIAGTSSGAASVELLMLSPMSQGLFNKSISESGSALSVWTTMPDPIAMAQKFITDVFGENLEDIQDIEDYYMNMTMEQLASNAYGAEPESYYGFGVCVEPYSIDGEESFLNESPLDIIKSGNYSIVPYMTGFASDEGLIRIDLFDSWVDRMEANFSVFLPHDLVFESEAEKESVADDVRQFYFGNESISIDNIRAYVDYFGDVMFSYSIIRSARLQAANYVPVYLYEYSYLSPNYPPHAHSDNITGVPHAAQSTALNRLSYTSPLNYTESDILMQDRLTQMWTDFAKYGEPVPSTSDLLPVEWQAMSAYTINYLSIDVEMAAEESLIGDRTQFWDGIYDLYYREPVAPSTS